jgi:hypothetical protein
VTNLGGFLGSLAWFGSILGSCQFAF